MQPSLTNVRTNEPTTQQVRRAAALTGREAAREAAGDSDGDGGGDYDSDVEVPPPPPHASKTASSSSSSSNSSSSSRSSSSLSLGTLVSGPDSLPYPHLLLLVRMSYGRGWCLWARRQVARARVMRAPTRRCFDGPRSSAHSRIFCCILGLGPLSLIGLYLGRFETPKLELK